MSISYSQAILLLCIIFSVTTQKIQISTSPSIQLTQKKLQGPMDCFYNVKNILNTFTQLFDQQTSEAVISDAVNITISIPKLLQSCGDPQDATDFKNQIPQICAKNLGQAANLVLKMFDDSSNQQMFLLDLILLKNQYDKKLSKNCPFLEETQLNIIPDTKTCMKAVSDLDDIYNKIVDSYDKSKYSETVDLFSDALKSLSPTLRACGQNDLAQDVDQDLPIKCINSLDKFGKLIVSYIQCDSTTEWIISHFLQSVSQYYEIQNNCPIFSGQFLSTMMIKNYGNIENKEKFLEIINNVLTEE